ncbi:MAG: response regulator [Lysobacterales bacterium]
MAAPLSSIARKAGLDPVNILLVDDQPARLMSYRAILEPLRENLVEAASGTEALQRLMDTEFAVILLDVNMPIMDGFETAGLIHQHPRFEKTPIIFVTAVNVTDMDRLRGYGLGAVDYVMVPVIPEILRSKVAVLIELHRKRRELQTLNASLAHANSDLAEANAALKTEQAREVHKLNEFLSQANMELERTNRNLKAEVAERQRAEGRLRDADRRKDEFLATLAHELRNPLAPIQGALNLHRLSAGTQDGPARELQNIMERQLKQMVRLIDDLLDVSRITRDKLNLRVAAIDLTDALRSAIESAKPLLDSSGHALKVDLEPGPMPIHADPQRLAQAFANLLNNAGKYTDPGGRIAVNARRIGDDYAISVRDTGLGLTTQQLKEVFDLFVQVDSSLERARGGLGIGLTLVRRLVEMHHGRIEARSDGPGRGSEFTVYLPIDTGLALTGDSQEPATRDEAGIARSPPLRILVVDDNVDAGATLAMSLDMLGHTTLTLDDPLAVIDAARDFAPQLAFFDVGMPQLNGFDLAERVRDEPWGGLDHLYLVALTGWGQDQDRRRSAQAGFDKHLVKPVDLATIEQVCREVADHVASANASASPTPDLP